MEIYCQELFFTYPGQSVPIFQGLSWSLKGPGFYSFFGFSGVGKSTLARLICGEISPDSGRIGLKNGEKVLYAHNSERLPGWGTIQEHLATVTPAEKGELLQELIHTCQIDSCLKKGFRGLSMGQKNRVNITRYLVQDFDLLILDEVLANVDEPARNRILLKLKHLFPDKTFVYISHNALEVARFSKRVLILPQGSGESISTVYEMQGLDQIDLEKAYPEELQKTVYNVLRTAGSGRMES